MSHSAAASSSMLAAWAALAVSGGAPGAETPANRAPSQAEAHGYAAISWHEGSVEDAFAEAEQSAKPVFLYWGAVWCPPCNALRSTLFQQPEFIAKTRDFVAVYLDGDTERAQVWGEKHDAVGYPTLIVFDPQGNQLTRLPGTLAAESFMAALDDAMSDLAPVAGLVQVALNSDRPLTDAEHRRLAYHSWHQDKRTLAPEQYLELFERLAAQAPQDDPVLARRAHSLRLSEAVNSGDAAWDAERYSELMFVLAAEEHDLDNLMMFSGKLAGVFDALEADSAQQEELRQAFSGALEAVLASPAGSKSAPLFSLGMLLELERLDNAEAPPSPQLLERILAAARQADAVAESQQERQSLIYYAYSLLSNAGEYERARILLEKELEISEEPYYFMYPLATLSHKTGDTEGAVRWMERYYRESYGPATRLQHGVNYVRRMMLWMPGNVGTILSVAEEVLAEMHGQPDALANRNLRSLGWLVDALEAWRAEHHADLSLAALDSGIATICAEHTAERSVNACIAMQQRLSAPDAGG